ncbi:unnamed protein product [Umbelopsis vinacea]
MKFSLACAVTILATFAAADLNITIPSSLSDATSALASVAESAAASIASPVNTPGYTALGSISILSSSTPSAASTTSSYSWTAVGIALAGAAAASALI